MKKLILLALGLFMLTCPSLDTYNYSINIAHVNATTISPNADKIVWRYKFVNNQLYKRKYNESKQEWVGDWIRA